MIFGQHTSISQSLLLAQPPNQFNPYNEIKSGSIPHTEIKSISTITKPKSISMLTLKKINFRLAHKNIVDFEPRTKNMPISVLTLKPSQFFFYPPHKTKTISTPTLQRQANFDPHSNNKSILRAPRHGKQVNFDADSKPSLFRPPHRTKSIMITALKSSLIRSTALKSRLFPPPTHQPGQFRCQH